ncbi:hypothetical protein [Janthinobacterium sp. TND4EL3]|uniref:hypothetical protein n=1 Tax=Janthinobacterium sp. TND4EL3 TaxID=1907311 RepID=UPI000970B503|nr:hypothetical protein [Janthinobacterium sp. TND4EL3]
MKPDQKQDCKVLTSERAIATATPAERTAHAKCIAEGYIESAATRSDFGGADGFSYAYALGLTGGWYHGALISEVEMDEYRARLAAAIVDREERDDLTDVDEEGAELEHSWSITARLAAVDVADRAALPPQLVALIQEAKELHPSMAMLAIATSTH